MNEYAIIFWLSFLAIFLGHFLFLKIAVKKLNIAYYTISLVGSLLVYKAIDYAAVVYGPEIVGTYVSQSIIGMAAGWFISRNLKNVFRLTNYKFLTSVLLILGWHNYLF